MTVSKRLKELREALERHGAEVMEQAERAKVRSDKASYEAAQLREQIRQAAAGDIEADPHLLGDKASKLLSDAKAESINSQATIKRFKQTQAFVTQLRTDVRFASDDELLRAALHEAADQELPGARPLLDDLIDQDRWWSEGR